MNEERNLRCTLAALVAAFALCACGGGEVDPAPDADILVRNAATTLLDDDGQPMPSTVRPADAGAWTGNGRYATETEALQLAQSLGDVVLQVEVECCGEAAVDTAAGLVWAMQASQNQLASRTHVLVRGRDERLAATTVNQLLQGGVSHVWLVTGANP